MNFLLVLTVLVIILQLDFCHSKKSYIPHAISEIIKNYCVKNSIRFDFYTDSSNSSIELMGQLGEAKNLWRVRAGFENGILFGSK